ncbi:putative transposable element [Trichonephila clavipes]|nr:putative transposable element [Trichonephila clavipes]
MTLRLIVLREGLEAEICREGRVFGFLGLSGIRLHRLLSVYYSLQMNKLHGALLRKCYGVIIISLHLFPENVPVHLFLGTAGAAVAQWLSNEAHFWLNGYVNKQNCRIWSEANPQVSVETPLHPEKLTVWCALWAGGILLQKR